MTKRTVYKRFKWISGDMVIKYRHSDAVGLEWYNPAGCDHHMKRGWHESMYFSIEELKEDAARYPDVTLAGI